MPVSLTTVVQFLAILLLGLVAGSVFGIWRGYDPTTFSPQAFLEAHQGAVRGLNTLLPATALASLACVAVLAFLARSRPAALALYLIAIVGIVAGGVVTRFFNQPINADVISWTAQTLPSNWEEIRDDWWRWHQVRVAVTIAGFMALIAGALADRSP